MAQVKPFKAVRPHESLASQVAALPYDVYSKEEAREAVKGKPLSFLNIDRPETMFDESVNMYAPEVYQKADERLQTQIKEGVYVQEATPCYYIYELTMDHRSQSGLVALSSIDDYLNNVCKKHENTVEEKEIDRITHVDVTSAQTGPIFLTYRHQETISSLIAELKKDTPLYDFVSEDHIGHRVWRVDQADVVLKLEEMFKDVDATYIADGHHRCASAVKVGLKRRKQYPDYTGEEEFNYFLSVLFPDDELKIMDYNRYVKDLNGYSQEEFLTQLKTLFTVEPSKQEHPQDKGQMKMYLNHQWYTLTIKKELADQRAQDPVKVLDVSFLQDEVLTPLLNIQDPRTDKRIAFIGGIRGLDELVKRVDEKEGSVAFAMYPTSIDELLNVADASLLMPPKSTWFEPKLRSGLFIHLIER